MKFSATTLALILLPVLSLASPVAEAVESDEGPTALVSEKRSSEDELFKRADQYCSIINVSTTVNCRAGPGTGYAMKAYAHNGDKYYFTCYKRGECVNGNCTWDYLKAGKCYINGYYTSSACSIANLGPC
ncbi:hypothetical protein V496_01736 [Pseudogymnoascus sp. VKM F-4515 (FW-2607)]|nr:hypothetical protein V496_01736 [Pseudogymnoascus sp. VKM F-4515 (FW-2607)]